MKNGFNLFCILFLTLLLLNSCNKQPQSGFSADKTDVFTGEYVKFTNTSTESYYYEWDFGDGNSSQDENPIHIFETSGEYSVVLTAFSKNKRKTNTNSYTINVIANEIEFNGIKYDLSEGMIEYYGNWAEDTTLYNFDLFLYNKELFETGIGQILYVELWSMSPADLIDGKYYFSYSPGRYIYTYAILDLDINFNTGTETLYECSAGSVYLLHEEWNYVFDISLYTNEGESVSVDYSGGIPIIDYSSKSKKKKVNVSDFDFPFLVKRQ